MLLLSFLEFRILVIVELQSLALVAVTCMSIYSNDVPLNVPKKSPTSSFMMSTATSENNTQLVNVSFVGVHYIFKIKKFYHFYSPNVNVNCQCNCGFTKFCNRQNYVADFQCAHANNFNQSCSCFSETIANESTCLKSARVCCQVYFTVPSNDREYIARKLTTYATSYKWKIAYVKRKDRKRNKTILETLNVPEHISRFYIDDEHTLELPNTNSEPKTYDWVYTWKGSNKLIPSESLNELDEQDMAKLGWFQRGYNDRLRSIRPLTLGKYLKLRASNCGTKNQSFEWELDAISYYHNEKGHTQRHSGTDQEVVKKNLLLNPTYDRIADWLSADTVAERSQYTIQAPKVELQPKVQFRMNMSFDDELRLTVDINTTTSDKQCLRVHTDCWNIQKCFEPKDYSVQLNCQLPNDAIGNVWICLGEDDNWKRSHLCKVIKIVNDYPDFQNENEKSKALFFTSGGNLFVLNNSIKESATMSSTSVQMSSNLVEMALLVLLLLFGCCISLMVGIYVQRNSRKLFLFATKNVKRTHKVVFETGIYHPTTKLIDSTT